jgi:hypothetical protein
MIPGRYVRLVKGTLVIQQRDLQGVIAQLHDLARHLERLIPDEDYMEKLFRSRDFSGGFALRAEYERALDYAVLEALAERRADHPYESLQGVEGYSTEQIESAVLRLWKGGLVDAHSLTPEQVTPGAVTTRGYRELQKIEKMAAMKGGV